MSEFFEGPRLDRFDLWVRRPEFLDDIRAFSGRLYRIARRVHDEV